MEGGSWKSKEERTQAWWSGPQRDWPRRKEIEKRLFAWQLGSIAILSEGRFSRMVVGQSMTDSRLESMVLLMLFYFYVLQFINFLQSLLDFGSWLGWV